MSTTSTGAVHSLSRARTHVPTRRRAAGTPLAITPSPSARTDDEQAPPDALAASQGRGLVLYVGLSEARARAAGTSLERIAYALRVQLDALLPEADAEIKLVRGPGGDGVSDLDVVREARQTGRGRPLPPGAAARAVAEGVDLDLDRQSVRVDGRAVQLSAQQFTLLRLLVEAAGITLSRHELAAALRGGTTDQGSPGPASRQVDVLVRRLRARLEPYSAVVRTVRGAGYRFDPHPDVHVRGAAHSASPVGAGPADALAAARQMRAALERHVNDVC